MTIEKPPAEVISLPVRRSRGPRLLGAVAPVTPATGPSVQRPETATCNDTRPDGSPCGLYLDDTGRCRVCKPTPKPDVGNHPAIDARLVDTTLLENDVMVAEMEKAVRGVLAFMRRRATGDYHIDEYGFDAHLTDTLLAAIARPLYDWWWRVRTVGIHNIPSRSGALLVSNHAGTLPLDAIMLKYAVNREHPANRHVRELAADLALKAPFIGHLARKTGSTLAHRPDAVRLLENGELVGVWPEGFKGIGKNYRDRYKLQRFGRGGFVEVAIRAGTPIIPVATIGSEEIYPIVANVEPMARLLNIPYFPITWQFPLLGPLSVVPLPSRWVIEFGEPIPTSHLGPDAADDPVLVFELTQHVRDTIQQLIYRNLLGRRSVFL